MGAPKLCENNNIYLRLYIIHNTTDTWLTV